MAATQAPSTMAEDDEKQTQELEKKEDKDLKKRKRLEEETAKANQRGVCYFSWVRRKMDPISLRHILSQWGEILSIYLKPESGWNLPKRVFQRVASMLNGQAIGGRKRSPYYYDLWNIKYLSKFKWSDVAEETAFKGATREQKLRMEISAVKKEKDFYLAKFDQSLALSSIEERLKKKQKIQEEESGEPQQEVQVAKVVRQFPQTKPVEGGVKNKPKLFKDILAGVFGGGSS